MYVSLAFSMMYVSDNTTEAYIRMVLFIGIPSHLN